MADHAVLCVLCVVCHVVPYLGYTTSITEWVLCTQHCKCTLYSVQYTLYTVHCTAMARCVAKPLPVLVGMSGQSHLVLASVTPGQCVWLCVIQVMHNTSMTHYREVSYCHTVISSLPAAHGNLTSPGPHQVLCDVMALTCHTQSGHTDRLVWPDNHMCDC